MEKKLCPKLGPSRLKLQPKWCFAAFCFLLYYKRKNLIKLIFFIIHSRMFQTTEILCSVFGLMMNSTASFFRHRLVEWLWIKFRIRPMLFRKSWNLFYCNVVGRLVELIFLSFCSYRKKKDLIRNIRLISKFMTSQPG